MIEAHLTPFDAAILAVRGRTASCSRLADHQPFTLQPKGLGNVIPGEIVTVRSEANQRRGGRYCITGEIDSVRLDAKALGLTQLGLFPQGTWDPAEEYWGEDGEPIEEYGSDPSLPRGRGRCLRWSKSTWAIIPAISIPTQS